MSTAATPIEFETDKGRSSMYAVDGTAPWSDVGQPVEADTKPMTAVEEVLNRFNLNWRVGVEPIYRQRANGEFEEIKGGGCTVDVSVDECLGFGGANFHPVQNSELAEVALALSRNVDILRGGPLQGGQTVFIQLRYPQEWVVAGQRHEAMVFLSNGHAWNRSLTLGLTDKDIVCLNSLNFAERTATAAGKILRFSHTKGLGERMKAVAEIMQDFGTSFGRYYQNLDVLAATKITAFQRTNYFDAVALARGGSEARQDLFTRQLDERWLNGRGQAERGDTLYRALSAVTDAVDHHVRPSYVEAPTTKRTETRFLDAIFDGGATLKRKALKLALDYVGAESQN